MKKYCLLSVLLIISFVLQLTSCEKITDQELGGSPDTNSFSAATVTSISDAKEEIRGVWIASVYNINFPSRPDLSENELAAELDSIVSCAVEYGLNTIYFQVHPAADALYRSDIFPVSEFLFTDGVLRFDPLEYMIEICHSAGIELFAWVNPLRVSTGVYDSAEDARNALHRSSPGRDEKLTVFYGDGKLYFNCGVSEVRRLVVDAVCEIADRYDVDGIVFDDYFYPYPVNGEDGTVLEFDDFHTYPADSSVSHDDWRRENTNDLIRLCHDSLEAIDPEIKFGVAPFGIWQNDDGSGVGSATSGLEAYHSLYCDAIAWIEGGYIDFISPQLYWEIGNTAADFKSLASFWNKACEGTGVDLVISHGIFRYEGEWDSPSGEIPRQIEYARDLLSYKGSILYGYDVLRANTEGAGTDTLAAFENEIFYYSPASVEMPVITDEQISGMKVTVKGFSDPSLPLTVNEVTVPRSKGGNFTCELVLIYGINEFVFSDGSASTTVTVIKR